MRYRYQQIKGRASSPRLKTMTKSPRPFLATFIALLALVLWVAHPVVHAASASHAHHDHTSEHEHGHSPSEPESCSICLAGQNLSPDLPPPTSLYSVPQIEIESAKDSAALEFTNEFFSPSRAPRGPPSLLIH